MAITIDGAGRVVIPKAIRERLGFTDGTPLSITTDGVGIRIEPVAQSGHVVERDGRLTVESANSRSITDEEIRRAIDAGRR